MCFSFVGLDSFDLPNDDHLDQQAAGLLQDPDARGRLRPMP
jgi:hypothetical protein